MTWLRDWCGIALPARGPACKPFRREPTRRSNDKESLSVLAVRALEHVAFSHPNSFVRSHAAGWITLAKCALRVEQSTSCVVNAVVRHQYMGHSLLVLSASVLRDKHPDPSKRKPRPVWGCIQGYEEHDSILNPLAEMLAARPDARCILLDTDSHNGDPSIASCWVANPLA